MKHVRFALPVAMLALAPIMPSAAQTFTVLHDFKGGKDGAFPLPGSGTSLVADAKGALYGVTAGLDTATDFGTVFKLAPPAPGATKWTEAVLYRFKGGTDTEYPGGTPLTDGSGGFYDTGFAGGTGSCPNFGNLTGCGTVFHLLPPATGKTVWTEKILYRFLGGSDGASPTGYVISDSAGALYGMTLAGGGGSCPQIGTGCGAIFRLTPPGAGSKAWTETLLYAFQGGNDGAAPESGLTADAHGVLYGVTSYGGGTSCGGGIGCGVVFSLTPPASGASTWTETILYRFQGGADGEYPQPAPVIDSKGALLGTAESGGTYGFGTAYKLTPPTHAQTSWTETTLHAFQGGADGADPNNALTALAGGAYATTTFYGGTGPCALQGGPTGCGTVVKLSPPASGKKTWTESVLYSLNGGTDGAIISGGLYVDLNGVLYGAAIEGGSASTCPSSSIPGCGTVFSVVP